MGSISTLIGSLAVIHEISERVAAHSTNSIVVL
jgi:hypothetical protein